MAWLALPQVYVVTVKPLILPQGGDAGDEIAAFGAHHWIALAKPSGRVFRSLRGHTGTVLCLSWLSPAEVSPCDMPGDAQKTPVTYTNTMLHHAFFGRPSSPAALTAPCGSGGGEGGRIRATQACVAWAEHVLTPRGVARLSCRAGDEWACEAVIPIAPGEGEKVKPSGVGQVATLGAAQGGIGCAPPLQSRCVMTLAVTCEESVCVAQRSGSSAALALCAAASRRRRPGR
jgi:hypothetical protein